MRNIGLIWLMLLIINNVYSQDCKYEVNEIDKFTHKKKMLTESFKVWKDIWFGYNITIKAARIDSSKSIIVRFNSPSLFSIIENSKFYIEFEDGTTTELVSLTNAVSSVEAGNRYVGIMTYYFTPIAENKLRSIKVIAIRIVTEQGDVNKDVLFKNADCFINALKCI